MNTLMNRQAVRQALMVSANIYSQFFSCSHLLPISEQCWLNIAVWQVWTAMWFEYKIHEFQKQYKKETSQFLCWLLVAMVTFQIYLVKWNILPKFILPVNFCFYLMWPLEKFKISYLANIVFLLDDTAPAMCFPRHRLFKNCV